MRLLTAIAAAVVVMCALPSVVAADPDLGLVINGPEGSAYYSFAGESQIILAFSGSGATFGIVTTTSLFEDSCDVSAMGPFSASQSVGVSFLERVLAFGAPGGMLDESFATGSIAATFTFSTEDGSISQEYSLADYYLDSGDAFARIVLTYAGDLQIRVLNGTLANSKGLPADLEVIAVHHSDPGPGGVLVAPMAITFTLKNVGAGSYRGPIGAAAGLSYADNWIPEWYACFCHVTFEDVRLGPGEIATFEVTLPVLPQTLIDTFRQRGTLFGSYTDPDPGQDYIGVQIHMGTSHYCAFIPFQEYVETMVTKKPKTD
jgi:hypothetical protein